MCVCLPLHTLWSRLEHFYEWGSSSQSDKVCHQSTIMRAAMVSSVARFHLYNKSKFETSCEWVRIDVTRLHQHCRRGGGGGRGRGWQGERQREKGRGRGLCMTHTLSSHCHSTAVALEDFWPAVGSPSYISISPNLGLHWFHSLSASASSHPRVCSLLFFISHFILWCRSRGRFLAPLAHWPRWRVSQYELVLCSRTKLN